MISIIGIFILAGCVKDSVSVVEPIPFKHSKTRKKELKKVAKSKTAKKKICRENEIYTSYRVEGGLVLDPSKGYSSRPTSFGTRLRTHVTGSLSVNSKRTWSGMPVPRFVPLIQETKELFILDQFGKDSILAFYRDPYGASSCNLSSKKNCAFRAIGFDRCGERLWAVDLNDFMSKSFLLEIQDVRMSGDGVLYFNEACQSYSKESEGQCSSLVALDPIKRKVLWKSLPLKSNAQFLVIDNFILSAYGFTAEKDFLFIIDRKTGKVVETVPVPRAVQSLKLNTAGSGRRFVDAGSNTFELKGWKQGEPKLIKVRYDY